MAIKARVIVEEILGYDVDTYTGRSTPRVRELATIDIPEDGQFEIDESIVAGVKAYRLRTVMFAADEVLAYSVRMKRTD